MAGLVTHTIGIAQAAVDSANVGQIEIDKIAPGAAQVGSLSLTGTNIAIKSGSARLHQVRFVLELKVTLHWWYNFGFLGSGGADENLGSYYFPFNAGDVDVPALNNIDLNIPNVTATNISAGIAPLLNLTLGSAAIKTLLASKISLPTAGFQLGGLGLGPVSIGSLQTPNASVGKVTVAEFAPTGPIVVPSLQLNNINLPSASAADIQSKAPFAINNIMASSRDIVADFDVVGFTFKVTPIINTNIDSMTLSNVSISGAVSQAEIKNVSVPVVITGVNLNAIEIGAVDVSNITL